MVALYEVVPANLPPGAEPRPAVDGLKYQAPVIAPAQLAEAAKSGEMMTVKLRYKAPDSDTSQLISTPVKDTNVPWQDAGADFQFAAAVAGFGMVLRQSPNAGGCTLADVVNLATLGIGADVDGYRTEFLTLVRKAQALAK